MFTYIKNNIKNIYFESEIELDENYCIGTSYEDYLNGCWIKLNDQQLLFKEENPTASVKEVFEMKLDESIIIEALKKDKRNLILVEYKNVESYKIDQKELINIVPSKYDLLYDCSSKGYCEFEGTIYDSDSFKYILKSVEDYLYTITSIKNDKLSKLEKASSEEEINQIDKKSDYPTPVNTTMSSIQNNVNSYIQTDRSSLMFKFVSSQVSTLEMSDEVALEYKILHPEWSSFIGKSLSIGTRVLYENKLYKVRQEILVVLENQPPSINTASLYEEINEIHSGTKEDPNPYNNNMQLELGKYYSQYGVVYMCHRDSEQAVYQDLKDLVGIYVTLVE